VQVVRLDQNVTVNGFMRCGNVRRATKLASGHVCACARQRLRVNLRRVCRCQDQGNGLRSQSREGEWVFSPICFVGTDAIIGRHTWVINKRTIFSAVTTVMLTGFIASSRAQEVSIPDPGLNAAVRQSLQKPDGPPDRTGPAQPDEPGRQPSKCEQHRRSGGGAQSGAPRSSDQPAHRLFASRQVDEAEQHHVSINPLTNFSLPVGLTNLTRLSLESAGLTNLTLPAGLSRLNGLDLFGNQLTDFNGLSNLTSLVVLDLGLNSFTHFALPSGLTNLSTFLMKGNPLTHITLPADLGP